MNMKKVESQIEANLGYLARSQKPQDGWGMVSMHLQIQHLRGRNKIKGSRSFWYLGGGICGSPKSVWVIQWDPVPVAKGQACPSAFNQWGHVVERKDSLELLSHFYIGVPLHIHKIHAWNIYKKTKTPVLKKLIISCTHMDYVLSWDPEMGRQGKDLVHKIAVGHSWANHR